MNRLLTSFLIVLIFSMHSAWAIGKHVDSSLMTESVSHTAEYSIKATSDKIADHCNDHCCHISAHATGLFSVLSFALGTSQQDIDTSIKLSKYFYLQTTPQRPPKV